MLKLLWLMPAIPFLSSLALIVLGPRLAKRSVAVLGVGSIALSAVVCAVVSAAFLSSPPPGNSYTQTLWTWMDVARLHLNIGFYLDSVSMLMTLVVTFVGSLIHWYSSEFMIEDEGYSRFFAYMNLFVASMLTLLLANNLVLLYLGWEGVGLCSYLLVGFWYLVPANGAAGRKAFIVTRTGDTAMIVGLALLATQLGTLNIQELMGKASAQWPVGSPYALAAALLLLGGAVGKSAQLPLQTWLPDAMAGPTPTSALLHAATMVTAGVYLIARTHVLFALAPLAQHAVAAVGIATLILAGFSALTQWDLKKVLAYSTISQIGYMFLALGVGAWSAAIFHFMTHAFFKALLFLGAGVVIDAMDDEHNMFKMGGLRKELPVAFWTFLIGGCSLAGLPLVTAGFYSKGLIIWAARASQDGSLALWLLAILGVLLTAMYTFRMIFVVFFGPAKMPVVKRPGYPMTIPLVVLAALSVVGGFVNTPAALGDIHFFTDFLNPALPNWVERPASAITEMGSEGFVTLAFLAGLGIAYFLYIYKPAYAGALAEFSLGKVLHQFWFTDWGMDWLNDRIFVRPIVWFAHFDRTDFIDSAYAGLARLCELVYIALRSSENGRVRWYAAGIAFGAVALVSMVLFL